MRAATGSIFVVFLVLPGRGFGALLALLRTAALPVLVLHLGVARRRRGGRRTVVLLFAPVQLLLGLFALARLFLLLGLISLKIKMFSICISALLL
jgi:hypothetical protein